jgi:predicted HTH domain antitoxin
MTICIDLPAGIESTLRRQLGEGLEQRAKEELAVSWFRDGRLTSHEVAELLGTSLFEAHGLLKSHDASLPMSIADVENDVARLRESYGS